MEQSTITPLSTRIGELSAEHIKTYKPSQEISKNKN